MRILIDIGHPAHVHLFRNFAHSMIEKGHKVLFTTREKEFELQLLEHYNLPYVSLGRHYKSIIGKALGLFRFTYQILIKSLKFKPDIFLSHGSAYAALASYLCKKNHISFEDTFNLEQIRIYKPFTSCILTGNFPHPSLGKKEMSYSGYHELAYLHPSIFKPESSVKKELGLLENEVYFIIRFVSWDASHDMGQQGLNSIEKRGLITLLTKYGKVFISSESRLPLDLESFEFPLSPDRMHHALAFATLFVGEGATMASEAIMLGTESIYINSIDAWTIAEQSKYEVIHHFKTGTKILDIVQSLLNNTHLKEESLVKRNNLIKNNIQVTPFLIWFIEKWPDSLKVLKTDPDYQYNFI